MNLGNDHAVTQMAAADLPNFRNLQGRLHKASKLHSIVVESRETELRGNHPYIINVIAICPLLTWGRAKLERDVLKRSVDSLGNTHELTSKAKGNLASTLGSQGHHKEAEELQDSVISNYKAFPGEKQPDTVQVGTELAITYRNQGRFIDANRMLDNLLIVALQKFQPNAPKAIEDEIHIGFSDS